MPQTLSGRIPGTANDAGVGTARPNRPRQLPRRRVPVTGAVGLALVLLLVVLASVGPILVRTDPTAQDLLGRLAPPIWAGGVADHPLGTDGLGQDTLARVVAGARVSLLIGLAATVAAGTVGVALGLVAGSVGGAMGAVVSWLTEVQLALPFVVVAIAVTATLGNGVGPVLLTLALTGWVGYARIVRLQTRALRGAPFVDAARSIGAGPGRVLLRHVLPNLAAPIAVVASQQVAAMILYEAALSYLGLGVGGDTITWGGMVADGRDSLLAAPWVATVPCVAVALAVLGCNLLGDWAAEWVGRR